MEEAQICLVLNSFPNLLNFEPDIPIRLEAHIFRYKYDMNF